MKGCGFMERTVSKYVVFLLAVLLYIIVGENFLKFVEAQYLVTFRLEPIFYAGMHLVFYVGIGILMGLPMFINYKKKKVGKLKINSNKLLIIGIPILYFSLFNIFPFLNFMAMRYGLTMFNVFFENTIIVAFQILFGYIVMISFDK